MAVGVNLVANNAHLPVLEVALGHVDPGVGYVGSHLALEEVLDALRQRHALGVAQLGVRLRFTVAAAADRGGLVAL